MKKAFKVILIIFISLFALCMIVYAAGLLLFNYYIMPNTSLVADGAIMDISLCNTEELEEFAENLADKSMTVHIPDRADMNISLIEDTGYQTDHTYQAIVMDNIIRNQDGWILWPYSIFQEKSIDYEPIYHYDEEMVKSFVQNWDFGQEEYPEDAYITLNDDEKIVIIDEKYGDTIDRERLIDTLIEHLDNEDLEVSEDEIEYIKPEVTAYSDVVQEPLAAYYEVLDRTITVNMTGAAETVRLENLLDMNELFYNYMIVVQDNKLDNYVNYLAATYNTYETQRDFKTHDGKMIKVGGNGDSEPDTYGFLMNWDETRELILDAVYDNTVSEIAASWEREAPFRDEKGDIGNTYIEISLTEQHLWYWVDGKLFLDTPVVTGLPTPSRMTPTGVYGIFSKGTGVNLIGEMDGEKWDSFVNYWLSVTYSEVGIHDAPWRGEDPSGFGGDIYTYNGSHGCINLPFYAEKKLYENTSIGTCVVIY